MKSYKMCFSDNSTIKLGVYKIFQKNPQIFGTNMG